MKRLIAGWTLLAVAAAVLGCSQGEKPETAAPSKGNGAGTAQAAQKGDEKGDNLTSDELAKLLAGKGDPHEGAQINPQAKPEPPLPEGMIAVGPTLMMAVPKGWVVKQPRVGIIEHEYAVPAAEGDQQQGRVTMMMAGGSVEANIQRWYGQFTQPDGSKTADKAKTEKKEIGGCKVRLVDISGTYAESMGGGPFAQGKVEERPGYRMLAAIIETSGGLYFVKLYGPQKTLAAAAAPFRAMVDGLKERPKKTAG